MTKPWVNPIHAARAKHKKKYCGKYFKGTYGINKKGCKKDELCIYADQGSGGEWCWTKKRKYTKKTTKKNTKKEKMEKNLKKILLKLTKIGKKSRRNKTINKKRRNKTKRNKTRKKSFSRLLKQISKARKKLRRNKTKKK